MARYTLEYRAPKHTKWHALSVSARAPFTAAELSAYRQRIAEEITRNRGVVVTSDRIQLRMLKDGAAMTPSWEFFTHSDGSRVRTPFGKIGPTSLHRAVYCAHVGDINDTHALRATLRAGKYTSYGCCPVYWLTSDGEALCFDCVRANYARVSNAIRTRARDGWRVVCCTLNYDSDLYCSDCNSRIESA